MEKGKVFKGESLFGMLFDRTGRRLGKRGDILRKGIGKLLVFRKWSVLFITNSRDQNVQLTPWWVL